MNKRIYSYLILGVYFVCGLALGFALAKKSLPCRNGVTVDIIKEDNEILIYGHYSGNLIFEYSKTNPADFPAYREFEDLWKEITSSSRPSSLVHRNISHKPRAKNRSDPFFTFSLFFK